MLGLETRLEAEVKTLEEDFEEKEIDYKNSKEALEKLQRQRSEKSQILSFIENKLADEQKELTRLKYLFAVSKRKNLEWEIKSDKGSIPRLRGELKELEAKIKQAESRAPAAPDKQALQYQIGSLYLEAGLYHRAYQYLTYLRGYPDAAQSLERCERALSGNANALVRLGDEFQSGYGIPKDEKEAARLYRTAAEKGNAQAQYRLGSCFLYGQGAEKDAAEAVKWYRMAAEQEYASAQEELGDLYLKGFYVKEDKDEALKWHRRAAENGDTSAQVKLGDIYEHENKVTAMKWYRRAAESGNANAQKKIGDIYDHGYGNDKAEALKWYQEAAKHGSSEAKKILDTQEKRKLAKMGLRLCPACGKQIALNAETCPGCGKPIQREYCEVKVYVKSVELSTGRWVEIRNLDVFGPYNGIAHSQTYQGNPGLTGSADGSIKSGGKVSCCITGGRDYNGDHDQCSFTFVMPWFTEKTEISVSSFDWNGITVLCDSETVKISDFSKSKVRESLRSH